MKKLFILTFLLHIFLPPVYAQDWSLNLSSNVELRTWKLSTKADKEEKGLGGATIKLFKGSTLVTEVKSLGNGDFKIDIPGNGEFTLEVSYPGCNTKKFAISTLGVPPEIARDNFRPSYGIGGFIMARALPGIDYSYLNQALVRVVYLNRGKFEDDNSITERSLKAVSKINEAENQLIEKFCSTNREGDAALNKPDCPLAKTLYEKAMNLIPGEAYPAQQLVKVGKCLQDKEAADKKAQEAAEAGAAKKDADKKAVEDAVAKAKADKAAKDQELNDKLAKAAEAEAKKKAAAEKPTAEAPKAAATPAPAAAASSTVKPKNSIIKIKEKSEEDLEADKKRAGKAKSEAEDAEKIRLEEEKSAAKKAEKEKKYKEHLAKEEAEVRKKEEERRQKEKEQAKKEAEEEAVKVAEERKKREEQEAKAKEEAKKEAEEEAVRARQEQEAREKEEAERAAAEKEKRKKRYEKIEEDYNNGKSKASYSIPAPLGSANVFKDKVKKADDLFDKKQYAEAKTVYEEALKLKPNDDYVTGKLAEISKLIAPEPPKQQ